MSWPVRALIGPSLWALAFAAIYALHGAGCALGWPHQGLVLPMVWVLSLALAALLVWRAPRAASREAVIVRAGDWIGLVSIALTLFPTLGLTSCG